jgi:purine-binding chemotaxis protein CheW
MFLIFWKEGNEMPDLITEQQEEDTRKGKYLTFKLGTEIFAIEISYVTEINNLLPITAIPDSPVYIKGIISLRGKIIPVIDMRLKFRKEPAEYNDRTCIIILNIDDIQVGLIVDNVAEVLNISDDNIEPPPEFNFSAKNRYLKGIGKIGDRLALILDCRSILTDDDTEMITKAAL